MTFDLHIHGETPAELLDALQQLNTSPTPQAQSEPVAQPDKPKAQTSTKQKKPAQKAAEVPEEKPANPTSRANSSAHHAGVECSAVAGTAAETPSGSGTTARTSGAVIEDRVNPTNAAAPHAGAAATTGTPAAKSAETAAATTTTPAGANAAATLDKIRDLARSLIVHGKRTEVQQIIKCTGAASISKLPPDSYTDVWQQLVNLSKEVDSNAAG